MNHQQKILEEIIRLFEESTGLTKSGQILKLDLIICSYTAKQAGTKPPKWSRAPSQSHCFLAELEFSIALDQLAGGALIRIHILGERKGVACYIFSKI